METGIEENYLISLNSFSATYSIDSTIVRADRYFFCSVAKANWIVDSYKRVCVLFEFVQVKYSVCVCLKQISFLNFFNTQTVEKSWTT